MVKHLIKRSFESSLTPEERQLLPAYTRYWTIYNLEKKEQVKYLKVSGTEHLHLFFTLEGGKYLVSNAVDRYIMTVDNDGKFTVKQLDLKINNTEYMFK